MAVADPSEDARDRLARELGVPVCESPDELPEADSYFLCVKPQDMTGACEQLAAGGRVSGQPVVSIAAGITTESISKSLGVASVVRTMPNTPLLVGHGCVFAHCPGGVDTKEAKLAERVFRPMGQFHWLGDERLMDAATALSGSGPAYAYLVIEAMSEAAREMGIDAGVAMEATLATVAGACEMVRQGDDSPGVLRERVTSKGGTTQAALEALERGGFAKTLADAMEAARSRSEELSKG